ncbi:MAG TPA: hypothetical protein VK609_16625 [Mucilaginibacter sp.]|nr:hypothetical protein [Mucilaginibacter sp.]
MIVSHQTMARRIWFLDDYNHDGLIDIELCMAITPITLTRPGASRTGSKMEIG